MELIMLSCIFYVIIMNKLEQELGALFLIP